MSHGLGFVFASVCPSFPDRFPLIDLFKDEAQALPVDGVSFMDMECDFSEGVGFTPAQISRINAIDSDLFLIFRSFHNRIFRLHDRFDFVIRAFRTEERISWESKLKRPFRVFANACWDCSLRYREQAAILVYEEVPLGCGKFG